MVILATIRFIFIDTVLQLLYFPVWWYTTGAMNVARHLFLQIHTLIRSFRFGFLLSFLLTPMYGQADIPGRIISFFVRCAHFFFLLLWAIVYSIFLFFLLALWLITPFFVVYSSLFHFSLLPTKWSLL